MNKKHAPFKTEADYNTRLNELGRKTFVLYLSCTEKWFP